MECTLYKPQWSAKSSTSPAARMVVTSWPGCCPETQLFKTGKKLWGLRRLWHSQYHQFIAIDTSLQRNTTIKIGSFQSCHTVFLEVFHWFFKDVLCFSRPLPKETKLKFDQDFKICWSFCFEIKLLNESKYSMPWVRCAFDNVYTNYPGKSHTGSFSKMSA